RPHHRGPRQRRGNRGRHPGAPRRCAAVTALLATLPAEAHTGEPWNAHDTRLVVVTLGGIALIVALIVVIKLHPFLALLVGSMAVAFAAGVPTDKVISNFESGVGATLQEVGLLIALGAMLGRLLADSGGSDRV